MSLRNDRSARSNTHQGSGLLTGRFTYFDVGEAGKDEIFQQLTANSTRTNDKYSGGLNFLNVVHAEAPDEVGQAWVRSHGSHLAGLGFV